ncbi:hypothetical protein BG004_003964 [Podila humilis]|nr:hypothetical protein BG004_003964 [Podila humilis]
MAVTLPPELVKIVAYHLQNNKAALHACLLVSHTWSKAAVEFLYKAEHMMNDYDFPHLSTLSFAPATSSAEVMAVKHTPNEAGDSIRSARLRPILSTAGTSIEIGDFVADLYQFDDMYCNDNGNMRLIPEIVTQLLLKRTMDRSLLHDALCSYDYISYLNKISCAWFIGLIQDWSEFCIEWRGTKYRDASLNHLAMSVLDDEPSIDRQEHCFNRLVRKLATRCTFIDEFRSAHLVQTDTLNYALRYFTHLTWLDLKDSQDLDDSVFNTLAETTRTLSYIRLPGAKMTKVSASAITNMLLAQVKNTLCQFKIIHGSNIFRDDSILKALGEHHGESLKRLTLAICNLEQAGLREHIHLCHHLASLNLEYSAGVTDDVVVPVLDACRHLTKLDLTETDCTQATIQALSIASNSPTPQPGRFASMKRLILNNIDSPFITANFLPLADACPNLEELHMNSILADTFQEFSQFIEKMKLLKDLDIGNVFPEFNDTDLASLVDSLPNLRWLSIANTQVTNVSLVYLAEHGRHLCDLCILGCDQITKEGVLEFLEKSSNKSGFRRLDLTYCRLEETDMEEIHECARWISLDRGLSEMIEIDGEDQFADNLAEEEEDDDDDEDEEGREDGGVDGGLVNDGGEALVEIGLDEEEEAEAEAEAGSATEIEGNMTHLHLGDSPNDDFAHQDAEDMSDFSNALSDSDDENGDDF